MFYYVLCYSMLINVINMPFDKGANQAGSSNAYKELKDDLSLSNLKISKTIDIKNCNNKHYRTIF